LCALLKLEIFNVVVHIEMVRSMKIGNAAITLSVLRKVCSDGIEIKSLLSGYSREVPHRLCKLPEYGVCDVLLVGGGNDSECERE
jgi:hypothetical protein